MNFLACSLIVLTATLYVAESQSVEQALIDRAHALVQRAHADIERIHAAGNGAIVHAIEAEVRAIEQLLRELRAVPHGALEQHHIHTIEEQLLRHENVLAEEVAKIEAHDHNAPHDLYGLIERAHALEQRAKADLARLHGAGRGHLVAEIEHQVRTIEQILHELRIHPLSTLEPEHAHQIEAQLAGLERALAAELRRLEGQA